MSTAATGDIEAFRLSLKQGSGRAMLLLRANPDDAAFHAALLDACLTNLVLDPQCEVTRAPYLARMVDESGQTSRIWNNLLGLFSHDDLSDTPNGPDHDRAQMFQVLCALASTNLTLDRRKL